MKIVIPWMMLALIVASSAATAQSGGCDAKRQVIEGEIAYARAHANPARVQGLQRALAEVEAHCTDESLRSDAAKKISKAQDKLAKKQLDLKEARDQGKSPEKITERQRKVDDAHAELEQAIMDAK